MVVDEQSIAVTFPEDAVRMLLVQPFLEFERPLQEPFRLTEACRERLRAAIAKVFEMVATHNARFVLLPEFAIPGVQGVQLVADHLAGADVVSPLIVIGGVSGLGPGEFRELCELPQAAVIDDANAPGRVQAKQWVNTSITFVKDDGGNIRMWLQPKMSPSWPETTCHHEAMFKGTVVRLFSARFRNGLPLAFFSLLCFDWIGLEDGSQVPEAMLQLYNARCKAADTQRDIQWAFVLQHNPSPNHGTFLTSTYRFLTQAAVAPFVRRKDAAVVSVSTAASSQPSRGSANGYGYSSFVFGPQAPFDSKGCWPTFATQSRRLRRVDTLGTCKDVVFREMGECIHLADIRVPNFVTFDATDRTPALVKADAFPITGATQDPRLPSDLVPAVVKWTNDELDEVPDFCGTYFAGTQIEPAVRAARDRAVKGYRRLDSQDLAVRIDHACAYRILMNNRSKDPAADVDTVWDTTERCGLRHVIQTLALVGVVAPLDLEHSRLHARAAEGPEIVAIAGPTHDNCINALKKVTDRTHSPIVLVSRDDENAVHLPREREFFSDPRGGSGMKHIDAQTLLTAARTKPRDEYEQLVTELMNVDDRRII